MKIVLVNIYPMGTQARYLLSSYMLKAYLMKYCPELGRDVTVVNFSSHADPAKMAKKINAMDPDILGFSCYVWNIELVRGIIPLLTCLDSVRLVFGGPEISESVVDAFLDEGIEGFFVEGEGEKRFALLLRALKEGGDLPQGVTHGRADARIQGTLSADMDLAEVPSVYLSGAIEDRLYGRQQAFLETQRGCRNRCQYCMYHKGLASISYYPVERITAEFDYLIMEAGVKALRIMDAIFPSDLERSKTLIRHLLKLKDKGAQIPWLYWEFMYSNVDDEFLDLAARLRSREQILNTAEMEAEDRPQLYSDLLEGYTAINCVGIQSFNPASLRSVSRPGISRKRFDAFMERIKSFNLVLKLDLILGLPHETLETFFQGLEYLLPLLRGTDHVLNIHVLQVLPGTDLADRASELGLECTDGILKTIIATRTMNPGELTLATHLSGILFRILNSPLREAFYRAWEGTGLGLRPFLESILSTLQSAPELRETILAQGNAIDDTYWNYKIFSDIPSKWLHRHLSAMRPN